MTARMRDTLLAGAAAVMIAVMVGGAIQSETSEQQAEQTADVAQRQTRSLAQQIRQACASPPVDPDLLPACATSNQVLRGPQGPPGEPGRGIASVRITDGKLAVTYTDGTTRTVGNVTGPAGPRGVGIVAVELSDAGELIVRLSDGTVRNLGTIVGPRGAQGPRGPGITDVDVTAGNDIIVRYSDGTSETVGTLPRGPRGERGPVGPRGPAGPAGEPGRPPRSFSFTIDGTRYECTPTTPPEPGSSPMYQCEPAPGGGG